MTKGETGVPRILQSHYVLAVRDLKRSAGFFVDALGFEVAAEPPGRVFVQKDNCGGKYKS